MDETAEKQPKHCHYLVVGLGNIGPEYQKTRHNIGFIVLDSLAYLKEFSFHKVKWGEMAELSPQPHTTIHFLKPTTYMNRSGKAVAHWQEQLDIPYENILVIADDIALPFGKIRLRTKGSSGGHNGLSNIEYWLDTQKYPRIKFGLGENFPPGMQVEYVLSPFNNEEWEELPPLVEKVCEMILCFCTKGAQAAMNQYN